MTGAVSGCHAWVVSLGVASQAGQVASVERAARAERPHGRKRREEIGLLLALVAAGLAARVWILVNSAQLSSDEAVPGLMAHHILTAHELPVFFWGQDYFGATETYLIAGIVALFGAWPWLLFLPALLASLALIPLMWSLANQLGPRPAGVVAAVPIAIAPPLLARGLVSSAGGFSLGFALMFAAVLCALKARASSSSGSGSSSSSGSGSSSSSGFNSSSSSALGWLALFALCAGFAMWIWQPAVISLLAVLLLLLVREPKLRNVRRLSLALAPVVVGLAPPLTYNALHGWPTLFAVFKKTEEAPLPGDTLIAQLQSFASLVLVSLGGGEDGLGDAVGLQTAFLAFGLIAGPYLILRSASRVRVANLELVLLFSATSTLAAYQGSRYLVPLDITACCLFGVVVAIVAARLSHGPRLAGMACIVVFGFANLSEYAGGAALLATPDLGSVAETQTAIAALQARGLTAGYADYWTAYPITYLSDEQIVVAPGLPFFWRARTDRYPPYTELVDSYADPRRVFALVDRRCSEQPYIAALDAAGATYQLDDVARWRLIWNIRVQPGAEAATLTELRTAVSDATC